MVPAGAPPALAEIAQRFAETSRGVVAFRVHRTFEARAGFSSRHEDLVMDGIYRDGSVVKVFVRSYAIDGRPADTNSVATVERGWENPKAGDVFAPPFDSRNFDAYQYQSLASGAIAFTSNVKDAGHGNGSFAYDAASNVVSCVYQPNVLPPHARSGQISDRRSEVLPGYWAVTQETQTYRGSVGPFAGSGTVEYVYSGFRRFGDVESAIRGLAGEKVH